MRNLVRGLACLLQTKTAETDNQQELLPMYFFFAPAAFGFLAIFAISLHNQFAECTNI
jgi:hypothetical protein